MPCPVMDSDAIHHIWYSLLPIGLVDKLATCCHRRAMTRWPSDYRYGAWLPLPGIWLAEDIDAAKAMARR